MTAAIANTIRRLNEMGCPPEQIGMVVNAIIEATAPPRRRLYERDFSGPCWVYCLIDPGKRRPFYIGISQNPWDRYDSHRHDRTSAAWAKLNELLNAGYVKQQVFKIYKRCCDRNAALSLEHRLITATPELLNRDRRLSQVYEPARRQ